MNQKHKLPDVMSFVDKAWKFYKENFKKLWPLFLFGSLGGLGFSFRGSTSSQSSVSSHLPVLPTWLTITIIVAGVIILLFMFLSSIALFKSITDIRHGTFVNIGGGYKKALKLFFPYLFLLIMIWLSSIGAGILFIVPGIILYGYLFFAPYEFFDQDKKWFAALNGSWMLVRDYWWSLAWRILVVGLFVGLVAFAVVAVCVIISVLIFILIAVVLKSMVVAVIFAVIVVIAIILFMALVIQPIGILSTFEIYYHVREMRAAESLTTELNQRRKNKIIAAMILGVAALIAEVFSVGWLVKKMPELTERHANSSIVTSHSTSPALPFDFPISTSTLSAALQKVPYTSDDGAFKLNLPTGWSFVMATSSGNDAVNKITVFISDSRNADLTVSRLNTAYIRSHLPAETTDNKIASELALAGVSVMKNKLTSAGLKGFQVSDLKKQTINSSEAYMYRGSASYGAPDYEIIDFALITVFDKSKGYQLLAIWPESEYGWAGTPIFDSMATFKLSN